MQNCSFSRSFFQFYFLGSFFHFHEPCLILYQLLCRRSGETPGAKKSIKNDCPFAITIKRDDNILSFEYDCLDHTHDPHLHLYEKESTRAEAPGYLKTVARVPLQRAWMHPEIIQKTQKWIKEQRTNKQIKALAIKKTTQWSKALLTKFSYAENEDYEARRVKKVGIILSHIL